MNNEITLPLAAILENLELEVERAAKHTGIYRTASLVWEDENTPRDGFLGYAMQEELLSFSENTEIHYKYNLVSEFNDLLDQIWYSSGLTQLYAKTIDDSFFSEEHSQFWIHHNSSMMLLSIASDRIKEFTIECILNKSESYSKKSYNQYVSPFKDLTVYLKDSIKKKEFGGVSDTLLEEFLIKLEPLIDYALMIHEFRKKRNIIVHDYTPGSAFKITDKIFDANTIHDNQTYNKLQSGTNQAQRLMEYRHQLLEKLESNISILSEWYKLLQMVGDIIFQADYMITKWVMRYKPNQK